MSTFFTKKRLFGFSLVATTALLVGCGSGSDGTVSTTQQGSGTKVGETLASQS